MVAKIRKNRMPILLAIFFVSLIGLIVSQSILPAATISDLVTGNPTLAKAPFDPGTGSKVFFAQSRLIDFGSESFNHGSGVTHGDVIKLVKIPPNTYVMGMGLRILRGSAYSRVYAKIGDSQDDDGFVTAMSSGTSGSSKYVSHLIVFPTPDAVAAGASVWQVTGISGFVSGASPAYLGGSDSTIHNMGPYFTGGASPYIKSDTINMTIATTKDMWKNASSGVTPKFEFFVWGLHRPTE